MITLRAFALVVLAGSAACAPGLVDEAGDEVGSEADLINGAVDADHPEVALVMRRTSPTTVGVCTGTLIGTHTVLTASHCVRSEDGVVAEASTMTVKLNDKAHSVARVEPHPAYARPLLPANDVAVLELVADVQDLRPLPLLRTTPVVGESVVLVGYGRTSASSSIDYKRRAGRNLVDRVGDVGFTMGGASGPDSGVCKGDSGGPTLFARGGALYVGGVHSTASCDERPVVAGLDPNTSNDTRVDRYLDFIETAARGNVYDGGAYEQEAPELSFSVVGGGGQRANAAGLMTLSVVASDDLALDRLLVFVNGERVSTLYPKGAAWTGEIAIGSPSPRADGKIWIQVAAIDRSGRRSNANQFL